MKKLLLIILSVLLLLISCNDKIESTSDPYFYYNDEGTDKLLADIVMIKNMVHNGWLPDKEEKYPDMDKYNFMYSEKYCNFNNLSDVYIPIIDETEFSFSVINIIKSKVHNFKFQSVNDSNAYLNIHVIYVNSMDELVEKRYQHSSMTEISEGVYQFSRGESSGDIVFEVDGIYVAYSISAKSSEFDDFKLSDFSVEKYNVTHLGFEKVDSFVLSY